MRNSKRISVLAGGTAALIGVGVAFAAWTTNGTGTGTATADNYQDLTVTVTPIDGLYPTGTFQVPYVVNNPNPYAVTLSKITLDDVVSDTTGCLASVITGAEKPDTRTVAAAGSTESANFAIVMSNSATEECKDAVFTLTLKAWGQSS